MELCQTMLLIVTILVFMIKLLDNIYWDRFNAIEENKERTNTNIDLSSISKEELEKELAHRAKK